MVVRERKKQSTTTTQNSTNTIKIETSYISYKSLSFKYNITGLILFFMILYGYLSNGTMTIGGDSTANMLLSLKLVKPGSLKELSINGLLDLFSFSPEENPCMFQWTYKPDLNSVPQRGVSLQHWNLTAPVILATGEKTMKSAWDLYRLKRLTLDGPNYFIVDSPGYKGRYVNTFGIGTALVSAPIFFIYTTFFKPITTDVCQYNRESLLDMSKFTASFFTSLSCITIYFISLRLLRASKSIKYTYYYSIGISLVYAFGTSLFSINSQALWQHAPNTLFITLGIHQFIKLHQDYLESSFSSEDGFQITITNVITSLSLCLAVYCRPTSVLYCITTILYLFYELVYFYFTRESGKPDRRPIIVLKSILVQSMVGLLLGSLFLLHNQSYFNSPFQTGQSIAAEIISRSKSTVPGTWITPFFEGAQMLLLSPSRGLFTHSPVFILSFVGLLKLLFTSSKFSTSTLSLRPFVIGMFILFYAASTFFDYWGGWCWSYRPLTDITPILTTLIIISSSSSNQSGKFYLLLLLVLSLASIFIQSVGAYLYDPMIWNYQVAIQNKDGTFDTINDYDIITGNKHVAGLARLNIDVPDFRYRLWSWSESQFLYLLKNSKLAFNVKKNTVNSWISGS